MKSADSNESQTATQSNGCVPKRIVFYTLAATAVAILGLISLLAYSSELPEPSSQSDLGRAFIMTLGLMFSAGAMGGCLYNFRGLTKHSAEEDYAEGYNLSYYLRPVAGGVSGLMAFFLLLGGALTLNIGATSMSWATLQGRMPYVALAILAGYGSHEFMLKLKDLAESVFALSKKSQ